MPIYKLNGDIYDIPEDVVADFEKDNPSATITYHADGDEYEIPVNERDGFLQAFPDATTDVQVDGPGSTKQPMLDAMQQQPTPEAAAAPTPTTTPAPAPAATPTKGSQGGYKPTAQEMAGFQSTIDNAGLTAASAVPTFDKKAANLQKRQGLKAPQQVKVGETGNLVKGDQRFNPETGEMEDTYITSSGNEYANKQQAEGEQRQIDDYDRRLKYATGQGIDELSDKYVTPMVDKALKDADERWFASMKESSSVPMGEGMEMFALRRANESIDPEKVLQGFQKSLEDSYKDPKMQEEISRLAQSIGMTNEEYLKEILAPSMAARLEQSFINSQISQNMPKGTADYILRGLGNSIFGMLTNAAIETKAQRDIKNQAEAMTEAGDNPYYTPGTGAKLAQMGVSFAADAPFFGLYGRVSGQVAKKFAERQIQNLIAKGLSEGAARSVVGTALENSVGARMKNYLMQHIIGGSLTLGGYNATSELARQVRDKEGIDPAKIAESTAEGLATGAAFGVTGGVSQALSQPLKGFAKIGAKAAGFGAEAETLYATEELSKMLHGEEAFTNPFEGSGEAILKLGVMKLSGPGGLTKLVEGIANPAKAAKAEHTGVNFTKDEEAYVRNTAEGQSLMDALSNMHPDRAISEVNGKKKLTPEGEQMRRQLADNYNAFMGNTEIPASVKQKVASALGGIYRPGLETGADIVTTDDGTVTLKTRDKDGNCIREMQFDTFEDADKWRNDFKTQMDRNDAVNMWNSATPEARQKIVDTVRDQISGTSEIAGMVDRASGMKQNRMKRDLDKVNELAKKYEGRELTEEEALNYIQTVIRDGGDEVFNDLYQTIRDNARPADEYNPKQSYQDGRRIDPTERHFAQVDAQLAEETLGLFGEDFAQEIIGAAEYPDEKIAELASRPDISGKQLQAAVDYYNKVAKVSGMYDETLKSVDNQVEAANAKIRRNIHTDSGTLMTATDGDGRQYYVTAGNVQITPDGRVDQVASGDVAILRDVNTGEIEVKNPRSITVTSIEDPNRLIEANESMDGLRGQLMREADDQIEYHPDAPTEAMNGDIYTGADGNRYMVMQIQDETGNSVGVKIAIDEAGNPVGEPMPFDMAEYRKAKSDEIDAAERPQAEEVEVPDTTEPIPEPTPEAPVMPEGAAETPVVEPKKAPETPATPKIPVDEKGNKLYEQAKAEDTLADLVEKRGEEKAAQMVDQMVKNLTKQIDELSKKDMSKITDMNEIDAHETEISDLQKKLDYWNGISDNIKANNAKKSWENLVNPKEIRNFATDPDSQAKWVDEHIDEIVDSYIRTHGNKLDPDEMRKTFAGMGYTGKNTTDFRKQEARVVAAIYERMLKQAVDSGNTSITLLTGAGGAGKSTATDNMDFSDQGVVYDSAFNKIDKLDKAIERAKAAGMKDIRVIAVYNDAYQSFKNSVGRGLKNGRFLSLEYFVNGAFLPNQGKIAALRQIHPDVEIVCIDNSGNKAAERPNGGRVSIDEAEKWDYTIDDKKFNELLNIVENGINEGTIGSDQAASIGRDLRESTRNIPDVRPETGERVSRLVQRISGQDVPDLRSGVSGQQLSGGGRGVVSPADGGVQGSPEERAAEGAEREDGTAVSAGAGGPEPPAAGAGSGSALPAGNTGGARAAGQGLSANDGRGRGNTGGSAGEGSSGRAAGQGAVNPKKARKSQKLVEDNFNRTFTYTNNVGNRFVVTVKHIDHNGNAVIVTQTFDPQGRPLNESHEERHHFLRVAEMIEKGIWKKQLDTDEALRKNYKFDKFMVGDAPVIDVLTEEEKKQILDAYEQGDTDKVGFLTGEFIRDHREDLILRQREIRNDKVEKAISRNGSRGERLRSVRKQYDRTAGELYLQDESMQPQTIEEYVADALGDVPQMGKGFLAYTSYDKGGNKIVGLKDETGFGSRGFAGDTKGFNPWLAPKGQGISLKEFAENIHEQLPEGLKQQYSDQDIRNIIHTIMTGAEKPTDIANYILRNRIEQAEAEVRHEEERMIDEPNFQKVADEQSFGSRLQRSKQSVNTEPTEAQKEAGNYKKGHVSFGGYDFTIENPEGSMRRGKDKTGREWQQKMNNTYGYILGKYGKDGDHLDMFINDAQDLDNWNGTVYVIDQIDPKTGKFDEHKVMYGFDSLEDAKRAYLSNYEEGWQGLGKITGVTKEGFDKWLDSSKRKQKEFADHSIAKEHMVESDHNGFDSALKQLNTRGISINDPELMKQYGLKDLTLSKSGDHVTLNKIVVENRGQGNGTRFMEDLARLADEKGWTLALTPSGGLGAKSVKRLKDFYKRFGFVDNKGRNPDYATRESMIRRPKETLGANTPEQQEKTLRDAVVDYLRSKGIEVSTDWKLGQKILDEYNGNGLKQQKAGNPIFFSNAMKSLDAIRQDKATPEQWLKMIEKNGGLKAGEDKWIGLSDWLNEQQAEGKKSITKQEIADYIRQHQIDIRDEKYSDSIDAVSEELEKKIPGWNDAFAFDESYGDVNVEIVDMHKAVELYNKYHDEKLDADNLGDGEYEMLGDWAMSKAESVIPDEKAINETRLGYTTNGLDNKREIALVVPSIDPYGENDNVHFGDAGNGRAVAWIRFGDTTTNTNGSKASTNILDDLERKYGTTTDYSKMSDEDAARRAFANYLWRDNPDINWIRNSEIPESVGADRAANVVALFDKLVADNAKGERVLVIDEIQSKRHQDARERGYKEELPPYTEDMLSVTLNEDGDWEIGEDLGDGNIRNLSYYPSNSMSREEAVDKFIKSHDRVKPGVPDAPFEKNWHELAMKRMLRYAAENGYDKIAWTTGNQQAERYDLGNQVKRIFTFEPDDYAKENGEYRNVQIDFPGNQEPIFINVDKDGKIMSSDMSELRGKHLSDALGKDLANKILTDEPGKYYEGEDLRIGGEGMKGFYDQILPRFMDKYGKKWGIKTGEVELPNLEESARKMHSIDVTPEMKESVMQGQPMFFKTSDGHAYGYTYDGKVYIDPRIATAETPIHEYGHLWCEMKRKTAPEEWNQFKQVMLGDKLVQPIIDKVKSQYPELMKEGREDDFVEEVITQFSGKRGNERLHEIAEEIAREKGGVFGKAEAVAAVQRLKSILNRFWEGVAKMMGWKYRNANQIADRIMADMLNGVNPQERIRQEARRRISERENLESAIRPQKVTDEKLIDELNNGKTVKRYRAMQLIDGKLYPPMSAKVDGEMREPTEIGVWEQSEERPDLIKNGKFVLNKGQKGQGSVPAAYNPYFHTSTSGLNDQFTSAYRRPELVVVEVEVPESELTSGYKAEGAKDAVGNVDWHSGVVNSQLPADRQRQVTLSRYNKVNRIVPDSEVADMIAKQLEGTNIEIPFNVVTPQLREELEARGVKISDRPAGTVSKDAQANPIRQQKVEEPKPAFYSNAMKSLEGIKQDKGTPDQWLKMIEKGGGLKVGEDKWIGLSDWLKDQQAEGKKSITKQEIEDYIRQHQIEVEDVKYGEIMSDKSRFLLDQFNEEFRDLVAQGEEETGSLYTGDWEDWAYEEMVNQHGDDFREAFDVEGGELVPAMDWNDEMSGAAKYYLDADGFINPTRLNYTTEGLDNKREIALTVPSIMPYNESDKIHFGDAGEGRAVAWIRFGDTEAPRKEKIYKTVNEFEEPTKNLNGHLVYFPKGDKFMAKEYIVYGKAKDGRMVYVPVVKDKEIAAFDTFDEARQAMNDYFKENNIGQTQYDNVLVIDEIQSKRHQDAREKGYKGENKTKIKEAREKIEQFKKDHPDLDKMVGKVAHGEMTKEQFDEWRNSPEVKALFDEHARLWDEYDKLTRSAEQGVPEAPFEKNWHELAMKRMLRYAAENGYDKVAWTTGDQQAERYNLGGKVKSIGVRDEGDMGKIVNIKFKEGGSAFDNMNFSVKEDGIINSKNDEINGKKLSEVVGKDLAEKIMSVESGNPQIFDGEDLRIGGEGMKGFYDQILPRFMDKYGKKWGIKTGEVELPGLEESARKMHSIDVTPEMKESVMQGQPMFQKVSEDDDRTLMGMHNISEEKLKKAIKQGGLANPSMAVFDTNKYNHTDYGEISLIPSSSLIDSNKGRNAGTYSGDAWTPTYPNVERFMTKKGDKHRKEIAAKYSDGDWETERHLLGVINDWVEGNGDRMHWLFLKQKGLEPEIRTKRTTHSKEEFDAITKIFGEPQTTMPSDITKEQSDALVDLMMSQYEAKIRDNAKNIKDREKAEKYIQAQLDNYRKGLVDENGKIWFAKGDSYVYDNWRDEKQRQNPEPDWYGTDNDASYRVAKENLAEEYEQWKNDLLNDEDIEERLFAGWTPDGNKRYVANTVENASRLMNKEAETNAYGNGGLNASKAGLLKKLKTLSEIRKYRHLLKNGEEIKDRHKEMEDEWFNIIHEVSDMQKIDSNPFINIDIAEARLQEAMKERNPIAYLNKEYGYDIDKDGEFASRLMNFIDEAKQVPVRYFETKFKRPVRLNEFAIAVVPTTTSPEVVKSLEDAGLEVKTYERSSIGDENDQNRIQATKEAVQNRKDIMFQRAGSPEPEMTPEERQYWNKWDQAMKKWRERNAIPETETEAPEKPRYQQGETAMDYAQKLVNWNRQKALWQTAPKLEDYRQVRDVKDNLEAAREVEKRYPDSPSAKMRRVAAELQQIRSAMSRQKAYDKATVKAVTDFAQEFMKQGFGDHLSRGEMERMLSSVKNATGAKDIKKDIDNIMNILIDNHLRNLDQRVQKLSSTKELSKTAQGVEKQGKLELKGQRMIQAFRQAREQRMTEEQIRERMSEVAEKMNRSDDEAPMWEQEYEGLAIALQYAENIEGSRAEYADLDREYKDAVADYKTSGRSYKAQQELLESIDQAMQENKIERIGLFGDIIGRLEGNIAESMEGAKEFVEREKERVKHIYSLVNFDLAGKESRTARREDRMDRVLKNDMLQLAFSPLATFEQMLKQFGARNVKGEGNLYNYFMRNYIDSVNNAYTGEAKVREELDAKAKEVFGDKVKHWKDLYEITSKPGMDISYLDGDKEVTDKLSQGNMLYIYMANKMSDGKMKLRKMGITEEDVDAIKEALDPRLVQLGDWLQSEYLPQKRIDYNKVHERMFGAPMAAIDNYFPIKVNRDAAFQDANKYITSEEGDKLPSSITGSIIKRTRNALPLDILHTDALSLAMEHLEEMEQWKAQAEFNRDVKDLLSNTTFRNKVKNMKTIYGSGTPLWNKFFDAATIATGDYSPKRGIADKTITNIAKGVTAAKINFRPYTAFKQLLSLPAFFHDVNTGDMAKAMLPQNYFRNNFKWAMENMPVFRKRWESRQIGDTRLMDDPSDWKIWKNKWMQKIQRGGMWANACIDALTCAAGAKAIYDTRYKKYKDIGASDEVAHKRALQDAAIGYNLTQQSSEGAFVSAIQKDRTVAANALSVFRNGPFAYSRQAFDGIRNLHKMSQKGYKEDAIDAMTRQFEHEFGLDEDQAKRAAELEYAKAGRHELAKTLNMMFGVTALWNLGSSLPYLIFGDDDETKKEMLTDAFTKSIAAGPVEGLAGGNIWSDLMGRALSEETRKAFREGGIGSAFESGLKQAGDYEVNPLPLMADLQSMIKKMGYDKYAAAQDLFNIAVQSYTGVNPQTITDIWNAAMDYGNPSWMPFTDTTKGNDDLWNSKEIALFIMRVLNAPTSSWRNKYIDELGMNAEDAKKLPYEEMAKRYANYKHWKDAPLMGWLRSDEARQEKMAKIQGQFDKAVGERMQRLTDEELMHNVARSEDAEEKRRYAKMIAQRLGVTPGDDSKKATDEKDWYQNLYQQKMSYEDIREDEMLADRYRNLENHFKEKREEAERKSVQDLKEFNKANKEWKDRIDEAKKEAKKRMDWIRGGKWSTPSGKKGNSKNATLQAPGKKQLETGEDAEAIMKNIRQWRREALEYLIKAEAKK